jgi:hypothetical protein
MPWQTRVQATDRKRLPVAAVRPGPAGHRQKANAISTSMKISLSPRRQCRKFLQISLTPTSLYEKLAMGEYRSMLLQLRLLHTFFARLRAHRFKAGTTGAN